MLDSEDAENRSRIVSSLDESLMVEASAGTGKTTVLVNRLVSVLAEGKGHVEGMVAVTFTRKAAGELKLRLRQELERARSRPNPIPVGANLEDAISRLEEARISTIHGFCADLLRERPVEAGIDPDFKEISDDDAQRLFDQAFRAWVHGKLSQMPGALSRALARISTMGSTDQSPLDRIRQEGWKLAEWRDFCEPWQRRPFSRIEEIDRLVDEVRRVSELSAPGAFKDPLRTSLSPARRLWASVQRSETIRSRDYPDVEARLVDLYRDLKRDQKKGAGRYSRDVSRQQVLQARAQLIENLAGFRESANADLAVLLQQEMRGLVEGYETLKRQAGCLDFVDLLVLTRDLVRGNREVREHFQRRFTHIFVDEFQDTDPLQAEIILLLSADDTAQERWTDVSVTPGKLFLVGDPKQSIYRFRRADVQLYQKVKGTLQKAGIQLLSLSRSFRSRRPVQEAVNAAFGVAFQEDQETGQPSYSPLLQHLPSSPDHPSVIALPVPEPFGAYKIAKYKVEASEPPTVAAFVAWLLSDQCSWRVRDPETEGRETAIQPRHICMLFRRFTSWGRDVTRAYVRALEARGVPHLLVGSRTFHQREEVEALRASLMAVEWPDDELAVYATLRGSLFAIPDALLFRFHKEIGSLHPFRKLPDKLDPVFEPIREALDLLADLNRTRNDRPIVDTLNELLEFTRAHAGFALRPSGAQILSNVQRVCDLARRHEVTGGISFRGFVEFLNREADKPRSSEGPILEDASEGVRIMTLHSAKGLEFPVVILADITCKLSQPEPDKYVDHDRRICALRLLGCSPVEVVENARHEQACDEAEGIRIAYVAATRARDILVIPAVGDRQERVEGWVAPLNPAIYPSFENYRNSLPAPNCPVFGEETVLSQPYALQGLPRPSIRPGLHRAQGGGHEVTWWDPALLDLKVEPDFGLRQFDILTPDRTGEVSRAGMQEYRAWQMRRSRALLEGSRPGVQLVRPTEDDELPQEFRVEVQVEILERALGRPSGRRFGTLVHTVLRDVPYDADLPAIRALAHVHARLLKADGAETDSAVAAVSGVLRHPLLNRARGSQRCHRELPVLLNLEDGRTLEGVVDLAFLEDDAWIIVDFKTDADLEENSQRYVRQVQWYLAALRRITQLPASGWLLGV